MYIKEANRKERERCKEITLPKRECGCNLGLTKDLHNLACSEVNLILRLLRILQVDWLSCRVI